MRTRLQQQLLRFGSCLLLGMAAGRAQDWVALDQACARAAEAGSTFYVVVAGRNTEPFIRTAGELPRAAQNGTPLLPLGDVSRVLLASLLRAVAGDQRIDIDKPIVQEEDATLWALGPPFTRWTWREVVNGTAAGALPAWRFLGSGDRARSSAEFLAAHALKDETARWHRVASNESSQVPVAVLQAALERRTGKSLAAWVRDAGAAAGLPSACLSDSGLGGCPNAEMDAAHDLTLTPTDLPRFLRAMLDLDFKLNVHGLERVFGLQPTDFDFSIFGKGCDRHAHVDRWRGATCRVSTSFAGDHVFFSWSGDSREPDFLEAFLSDLDEGDVLYTGAVGYGEPRDPEATHGIDGEQVAELKDLDGTIRLSLSAPGDQPCVRLGPREEVIPLTRIREDLFAEFGLGDTKRGVLDLRFDDGRWIGTLSTYDNPRYWLPWRITFERAGR
ncbi:MAG: hypothetical protein AB7I19_04765 [Planctomycetota bacterium]